MTTNRHRLLLAPLAALTLGLGAVACGDDGSSGDLSVADAWVRQPAVGQTNVAGYGTITNSTGEDVTLIGASAPLTATFEIHETLLDDGVMSMQERTAGFVIGDGETFVLEPGGPHVMIVGVDPAELADELELTFVFDRADPVTAPAEVREIAGEPMGDLEMEDGETDGEGSQERLPDPMDGDDMNPVEE